MLSSFRFLRAAIPVMALVSLVACSKKEEVAPTPAVPPEGMTWTVDGGDVTAATSLSQLVGTTLIVSGVATTSGATTSILLQDVPKTAGLYPLTSTSVISASYIVTPATGSASQFYEATTGSIAISSVTATNIIGTFTFSGLNVNGSAKNLTNGKFNVKL